MNQATEQKTNPIASHSCTSGNPIQQVLSHIKKKAKTNERKWQGAQNSNDKQRFGVRARMCKELLNELLLMFPNKTL